MSSDFDSIEKLLSAFYKALDFSAELGPDYETLDSTFHEQVRITPPIEDTGGTICSMTGAQFMDYFRQRLDQSGVTASGGKEEEIWRTVAPFNRIAVVLSGYHFYLPDSPEPVARGVNSFQLVHDQNRWWIFALTWDRAAAGQEMAMLDLSAKSSN